MSQLELLLPPWLLALLLSAFHSKAALFLVPLLHFLLSKLRFFSECVMSICLFSNTTVFLSVTAITAEIRGHAESKWSTSGGVWTRNKYGASEEYCRQELLLWGSARESFAAVTDSFTRRKSLNLSEVKIWYGCTRGFSFIF